MKMMFLVFLVFAVNLWAQGAGPLGSIEGNVYDRETLSPLIGVNIIIKKTGEGTASDAGGKYIFENIEVGTYALQFSYIGYNKVIKTDVIVRPLRTTYVNAELQNASVEIQNVIVEGGYFSEVENKPVSAINFSAEEIRRAPGSAGDVSRIVYGLPSLAKVNDSRNSLIVRGGSPLENSFYLDNIEIPNINHFQIQGSSDGPIGLLNTDFIDDVNFYSGGFSPAFGDRLSSIMEISYREGSKSSFNPQVQMSMAGFGAGAEGPIGNNGSYMFSAGRSYLDLIVDQVQTGGALPKYGDFQGKLVYNINDNNKLTVLNLFSKDDIGNNHKDAVKGENNFYGVSDDLSNVAGINWRHIWDNNGYSNTSLSYMLNSFDRNYHETKSQTHVYHNISKENNIKLRNVNYLKVNKRHSLEFGLESSGIFNSFDVLLFGRKDMYGNFPEPVYIDKNHNTVKGALFAVHHWNFMDNLKVEYGGRIDYFEYTSNTNFSPRINLTYNLNDNTSLSAGAGVFYQNIPGIILTQNDSFKDLKTPRADHYILSFAKMIGGTTRLSIEAYYKNYSNLPINPEQPHMFLFDQVMIDGLFLVNHNLNDNGKAFSRGIEVMVQKKLANDFYGMAGASYSKSRYKDLTGVWRNRIYDNEFNFSLEGGYLPNDEWEFKVRWIYAGGAPYTPFDITASKINNRGIWDVENINSKRLPDYHSLNIRIDKRFYFRGSNLVLYLSIWNAYARENIAAYTWNEIKNEPGTDEQWSTLPVIGFEFEF
jgi:hypothetical protein